MSWISFYKILYTSKLMFNLNTHNTSTHIRTHTHTYVGRQRHINLKLNAGTLGNLYHNLYRHTTWRSSAELCGQLFQGLYDGWFVPWHLFVLSLRKGAKHIIQAKQEREKATYKRRKCGVSMARSHCRFFAVMSRRVKYDLKTQQRLFCVFAFSPRHPAISAGKVFHP